MNQRFTHLVIVLPCHSLEDFPTHHRGSDADNLLGCWTGLWHPALLSTANDLPSYHPAEFSHPSWNDGLPSVGDAEFEAGESVEGGEQDEPFPLVVIPRVAQSQVDSGFLMDVQQSGIIVEDPPNRDSLVAEACRECSFAADLLQQVDSSLAEEFMALGYAYLQIQLMTRQLRYSSNLDENRFRDCVLTAARAVVQGDSASWEDQLVACYDLLLEEKNAYYPVEPQLCDLTLVSDSTAGEGLSRALDSGSAINLLMTGSLANSISDQNPETAARISHRVDAGTLSIVGGDELELPNWLVNSETLVDQLQAGCQSIEQSFGKRPRVFARRRFGLHPSLPNILHQMGFVGAIHATFDGGTFPRSANGVMRWTGDDDESILSLADVPLDASDPGSFIGLGIKLGEMIDSAHMASALFVHWPDTTCQAYDDLQRITRLTPLFGDFVTLDHFFDSAYDPGYGDQFAADEYRTPYLKQALKQGIPDPVSRWIDYWQRVSRLQSIQNVATRAMIRHQSSIDADVLDDWNQKVTEAQSQIDASVVDVKESTSAIHVLDQLERNALSRWAGLEADPDETGWRVWPGGDDQGSSSIDSVVLVNPVDSRVRSFLERVPGTINGSLKNQPPIWLAHQDATSSQWLAELPANGAVSLSESSLQPGFCFEKDPPVVEGLRLQNEYFYLEIDDQSGGLRCIGQHGQRVNLLGQQLAVRIPTQGSAKRQPARYTQMVCRSTSSSNGPLTGSVTTRGELLDGDGAVASFEQTISVARGMSRIGFEVQVDWAAPPGAEMNHYLCSRFAWKDESAPIFANSVDSRQQVTSEWFHATQFITIGSEETVTVLTGGLPYHRRANRRMIDSILVCAGESRRRFKFAVDIGQRYGLSANRQWLSPPTILAAKDVLQLDDGWCFHINCKNVSVTSCRPMLDDGGQEGFELRLKETEGRLARATIRSRRRLSHACQNDFLGSVLQELEINSDSTDGVQLELPPYALVQLSFKFQS